MQSGYAGVGIVRVPLFGGSTQVASAILCRPSGIMKFVPAVTGYAKLVIPVAIGAHNRDLLMAIRGVLRHDPVQIGLPVATKLTNCVCDVCAGTGSILSHLPPIVLAIWGILFRVDYRHDYDAVATAMNSASRTSPHQPMPSAVRGWAWVRQGAGIGVHHPRAARQGRPRYLSRRPRCVPSCACRCRG